MLPPGTGGGPCRGTASPTDGLPSRGRLYGGTVSPVFLVPGSPRYVARSPLLFPAPVVMPLLFPPRGTAVPALEPVEPEEPDGPRIVESPPPPARAVPVPPRSPPIRAPPPPPEIWPPPPPL